MIRFLRRLYDRWLPREEWKEEIESHLAMSREWRQQHANLSPEEADASARRSFGSPLKAAESIRDVYPAHRLEDLAQDIRHAFRLFRLKPGFCLGLVATTAIGIAAATTVFSIVDPLLFRPLPFRDGDRLVSFGLMGPIDDNEFALGPIYSLWQKEQTAFAGVTSTRAGNDCDVEASRTERVYCIGAESNFLPLLGVRPVLGRNFTSAEDLPHAPLTALISDRLWRSLFAAQPDALGRVFKVDAQTARVIGVLPPSFVLPEGGDVDVLLPAQLDRTAMLAPSNMTYVRCFGRLKSGVSLATARRQMESLGRRSLQFVPPELRKEIRFVVQSVRDRSIHSAKLASWILFGAVLFLLLLACLTLANLLLARSIAREDEFTMRTALGATRGRLFRQSFTETALFAVAGASIGVLLSVLLLRCLVLLAPGGFLHLENTRINGRVLFFSLLASLVTITICGMVPALSRPSASTLRSRATMNLDRVRLRQVLVVVQLACSLVLLSGALLFGKSLNRIESEPTGLVEEHLVTATFNLSHARYTQPDRLRAFYTQLESRLSRIPGVSSFALSDSVPPSGRMHGRPLANILVNGHAVPPANGLMVGFRYVSPDYFAALKIPILQGSGFSNARTAATESSLVINATLARRLFPSENPIGQRVSLDGSTGHWLTVIGVVRDVKNNGLNVPVSPEYYRLRSLTTNALGHTAVALFRTGVDTITLSRWIRSAALRLDPTLSVDIETMQNRVYHLADRARFVAFVIAVFALTSLVLAASGLFGVISFLVTRRTREIATRSALGATRFQLLWLVQKQTALWAGLGIALGLAGTLYLGHFAQGFLYQVQPLDPLSLALACSGLLCVALCAAWYPSRRAAEADPAQALRSE